MTSASSKIWCWWCCHPFPEECEVHLPYKYDDRRKRFYTTGHFCSWSCSKAYVLDKHGVNKGGIICGNISLMKRSMSSPDKKYTPTSVAPDRNALKVFGGTLTIEEFRQTTAVQIRVHYPNETHTLHTVVIPPEKDEYQTGGGRGTNTNANLMSKIETSSTSTNEPLKLRRSKPTKKATVASTSSLNFLLKSPT